MNDLPEILRSLPTLRQVNYENNRPVIVMVDTRPIAIGQVVRPDDVRGNRFATRFANILFIEY